ncbi:MAG TPA: alpha/beta hydrolase [Anaeromyxobacter sp.]|nr:alpha/beta hydrolase [Anaeromyxobacter sp.]
MQTALAVLGVVLLAGAATALHWLFWTWRLAVPPREDELLAAPTRDGWLLALGHNRPRGAARRPPVLLVHGIAMNRQAFEFGLERWALAPYLARAGLDCFALDHRGHGGSRRAPGHVPRAPARWSLDTYLAEDVPAALDAIRARTGEERVLWVGHSQGALIGLAACALYPERIAGIVALAGPVRFDAQPRVRRLLERRLLGLEGRMARFAARMIAPFAGLWHPPLAELAIRHRNVEPRVSRRLLANAIEDLQPGVVEQFRTFFREDAFRSMDGATDHRAALARCRQPALFVAAERDGLAPPPVVEAAHRLWGGPKRYVLFERGFGHTDLLLGRDAPEVVFPVVLEFLLGLSREAGGAPRGEPVGDSR